MPLIADERTAIELAFMRGPSALLEMGWNGDQIEKFFARPDVKLEVEAFILEFKDSEAHASRLRFGLKRQLARFGSGATAVLGAALAGPIYARDKDGRIVNDAKGKPVLMETGPTRNQLVAATEILDRVGVNPDERGSPRIADRGEVNINLTFAPAEKLRAQIAEDPTHTTKEEKALSRERCRTAIDILSERLPEIKKRVAKALPSGKVKKKRKKKKKKKKAKAAT